MESIYLEEIQYDVMIGPGDLDVRIAAEAVMRAERLPSAGNSMVSDLGLQYARAIVGVGR